MKKYILYFLTLIAFFNCNNESINISNLSLVNKSEKAEFAIIIHGGAGTILKKNMTPEREAEYKTILEKAIRVGHNILKNGGSSLDAVEKTINVMEDSPSNVTQLLNINWNYDSKIRSINFRNLNSCFNIYVVGYD